MLCHQIGESETAFERYLEPDERPAADDRYDRQNERQLVRQRIGSGSRRALHRSAPRSEPREMPIAFAAFDIASRTDTVVGRGVSRRAAIIARSVIARSCSLAASLPARSEERRVGEECVRKGISRWSPYH